MKALDKQVEGNHYKQMVIQPAVYCYLNNMNNLQSEAISYISRAPLKNGKSDVKKAIHTLEIWLELWEQQEEQGRKPRVVNGVQVLSEK